MGTEQSRKKACCCHACGLLPRGAEGLPSMSMWLWGEGGQWQYQEEERRHWKKNNQKNERGEKISTQPYPQELSKGQDSLIWFDPKGKLLCTRFIFLLSSTFSWLIQLDSLVQSKPQNRKLPLLLALRLSKKEVKRAALTTPQSFKCLWFFLPNSPDKTYDLLLNGIRPTTIPNVTSKTWGQIRENSF